MQTLFHPEISSAPGSVGQVRECTAHLMRLAKGDGITVLLVGHVTKDGSLAGPRVMEHLVDTVLYFEGDGMHHYRILKAIKNRFGPTHEVGLFEMQHRGLVDLPNASEFFLSQRVGGAAGSVIVPVTEGTRSMLVEIQALCNSTGFGYPARKSSGVDANRLVMLLAVLQKHAMSGAGNWDVFVNVAGG
ncbi:MAG: DNA repair protein RadA, partial [Armatimonadetes bacterium]|nr:DNA repair protein RadA [Armatimonadota bacterium]